MWRSAEDMSGPIPTDLKARLEAPHRLDKSVCHLLDVLETDLQVRLPSFLGYSPDRLARRVAQLILRDDWQTLNNAFINGLIPDLDSKTSFSLHLVKSGVTLSRRNGRLHLRPGLAALGRGLISIVGVWIYVLLLALVGYFRPRAGVRQKEKLGVFNGAGLKSFFSDADVEEGMRRFMLQGPVSVFRDRASVWFIHSDFHSRSRDGRLVFTHQPYLQIPKFVSWKVQDILNLFYRTIATGGKVLGALVYAPILILLKRDFGFEPLVRILNKRALISDIVLTNSQFLDQEIWLSEFPGERAFRSHMVWYSTNTQPFRWNFEHVFSQSPSTARIEVDTGWVWNDDHGAWVRDHTRVKEIRVCGPILFNTLSANDKHSTAGRQEYDVLIFDVTPITLDWFKKNVWQDGYYYFQSENMKRFISDILAEVSQAIPERRPYVALKHKREYHPVHDTEYIEFIRAQEADGMRIAPATANIIDLVRKSAAVVVIPFSAPAYVAEYLDKPVLYYDPTGLLARPEWQTSKIEFANTVGGLRDFLRDKISSRACAEPRTSSEG